MGSGSRPKDAGHRAARGRRTRRAHVWATLFAGALGVFGGCRAGAPVAAPPRALTAAAPTGCESASVAAPTLPAPSAPAATSASASAEASPFEDLPPAVDRGGPTKPCPRHQMWGNTGKPPPGGLRAAGRMCDGMWPVWIFPTCRAEQVERAIRVDVAPFTDRPIALRGYLRRDWLSTLVLAAPLSDTPPPALIDKDRTWSIRLEARTSDGHCAETETHELARGDE